MPLEKLCLDVDFFCGIGNACMRVATRSNNVVLYRIPYDYALVLDSKNEAKKQGYMTDKTFRDKYQKELKMAGIYILIETEKNRAYIGRAESRAVGTGLIHRMLEDYKRKSNPIKWDIGFALTSKTEDLLSQDELSHLEWLFYHKAKESKQYTVSNGQIPSGLKSESKKADVEEKVGNFMTDAFNMLSCQAGCDVFVSKQGKRKLTSFSTLEHSRSISRKKQKMSVAKPNDSQKSKKGKNETGMQNKKMLHMNSRKADAYGFYLGEIFVVKAGSKLAFGIKESLKKKPSYYKHRLNLEKNGVDNNLVLLSDEVFDSISEAACVIGGTSLSGTVWKEIKETTLDLPFGD